MTANVSSGVPTASLPLRVRGGGCGAGARARRAVGVGRGDLAVAVRAGQHRRGDVSAGVVDQHDRRPRFGRRPGVATVITLPTRLVSVHADARGIRLLPGAGRCPSRPGAAAGARRILLYLGDHDCTNRCYGSGTRLDPGAGRLPGRECPVPGRRRLSWRGCCGRRRCARRRRA